jgi:hypothetical protein
MSLRATRGVCIGVDRHLVAGDLVPPSVDAATLRFLVSIKAIAEVAEEIDPPQPTDDTGSDSSQEELGQESDTEINSEPRKRGRKEK